MVKGEVPDLMKALEDSLAEAKARLHKELVSDKLVPVEDVPHDSES